MSHALEKCGHLPMQEHPEAFNQWVLEFLAQQATGEGPP